MRCSRHGDDDGPADQVRIAVPRIIEPVGRQRNAVDPATAARPVDEAALMRGSDLRQHELAQSCTARRRASEAVLAPAPDPVEDRPARGLAGRNARSFPGTRGSNSGSEARRSTNAGYVGIMIRNRLPSSKLALA